MVQGIESLGRSRTSVCWSMSQTEVLEIEAQDEKTRTYLQRSISREIRIWLHYGIIPELMRSKAA